MSKERLEVQRDPPFQFTAKVRTLATVKPALARLLEWRIDQQLERSE